MLFLLHTITTWAPATTRHTHGARMRFVFTFAEIGKTLSRLWSNNDGGGGLETGYVRQDTHFMILHVKNKQTD